VGKDELIYGRLSRKRDILSNKALCFNPEGAVGTTNDTKITKKLIERLLPHTTDCTFLVESYHGVNASNVDPNKCTSNHSVLPILRALRALRGDS
jgi:hypothetical protein